jgi:hypothetical protein
VSQVVRLGDTQETDGGPLRLDTYEKLCALETLLTRESDAFIIMEHCAEVHLVTFAWQ